MKTLKTAVNELVSRKIDEILDRLPEDSDAWEAVNEMWFDPEHPQTAANQADAVAKLTNDHDIRKRCTDIINAITLLIDRT